MRIAQKIVFQLVTFDYFLRPKCRKFGLTFNTYVMNYKYLEAYKAAISSEGVYLSNTQNSFEVPNDALFTESYELYETAYYKPRDIGPIIENWNWLAMQPKQNRLVFKSFIDKDNSMFSRTEVLPYKKGEKSVPIIQFETPARKVFINEFGQTLADIPMSSIGLGQKGKLENLDSLLPLKPFQEYSELNKGEIMASGYNLEEYEKGYRFWNDEEELIFNTSSFTLTQRKQVENLNDTFYSRVAFDLSPQGFMQPRAIFQKTKVLLEGGIIADFIIRKSFRNYQCFYSNDFFLRTNLINESLEEFFELSPNPTDGPVCIRYTGSEFIGHSFRVIVVDALSQPVIYKGDCILGKDCIIDMSKLEVGPYHVHIKFDKELVVKTLYRDRLS